MTSSYLSDSTVLWNENQAYVLVSFETVACSNGLAKRSLGHSLVEARCDEEKNGIFSPQSVRTSV